MRKNNDIDSNARFFNNFNMPGFYGRRNIAKISLSDVLAQFYQKKIRKKQIFRAFSVEKLSQLINYNRKQPNESERRRTSEIIGLFDFANLRLGRKQKKTAKTFDLKCRTKENKS